MSSRRRPTAIVVIYKNDYTLGTFVSKQIHLKQALNRGAFVVDIYFEYIFFHRTLGNTSVEFCLRDKMDYCKYVRQRVNVIKFLGHTFLLSQRHSLYIQIARSLATHSHATVCSPCSALFVAVGNGYIDVIIPRRIIAVPTRF